MGKPYRRVAASAPQADPSADSLEEEEQQAPARDRIDLGDTAAIKRTFDEVAAQVVLKNGFRENFTVSNVKIGLGVFTCCWALLAQFYPKKYPHNWHVLVLCLVAYIICTTVLNGLMWWMEGDTFLFSSTPQQGQPTDTILSLSSQLPKYQDVYTLLFQSRPGLAQRPQTVAQLEGSVTAYFDAEGSLLEEIYRQDVQQALKRYLSAGKKRI